MLVIRLHNTRLDHCRSFLPHNFNYLPHGNQFPLNLVPIRSHHTYQFNSVALFAILFYDIHSLMFNSERIPNADIDRYSNPPLHPTNPKYSREAVAARLASKRVLFRESMEAFNRNQAESVKRSMAEREKKEAERRRAREASTAKQKEPNYEDNLSGYGTMLKRDGSAIQLRHTADNDLFFRYESAKDTFLLRYKGSAEVVKFLQEQPAASSAGEDTAELALFTTEGEFYSGLILKDLRLNTQETRAGRPKHTAVFHVPTGDIGNLYDEMNIAVDDIYCVDEITHNPA